MQITKNINQCRKAINKAKQSKKRIGFVPTMGALHEGHLSLIRKARKDNDFVAISIFVNPLQFGPTEDYTQYPRDFKRDEKLLKKEKVDLIFYPQPKTMYPEGFSTYITEEYLSQILCGRSRPIHFKGVTTIVAKLFNIIEPENVYFGQKDYQQAKIIQKMIKELNFPIKMHIMPIKRENDKVAISSRNYYLSKKQREDAKVLYQSLIKAKKLIQKGKSNPSKIKQEIKKAIKRKNSATIDYVDIIDIQTLRPVKQIKNRVAVVMAVYIGKTKLIDNIIISKKRKKK